MTHIIRKVEYITGTIRNVFIENIETDNIERTRQELHQCVKCERVLLTYDTIEEKAIKK